nr:acyl-coenzyme A diphosphatase FITM2-like [Lytechinus pictus]
MATHARVNDEMNTSNVSRRKNVIKSNDQSNERTENLEEEDRKGESSMDVQTAAFALSIMIVAGSILRENEMVPDSFFADKHNPLNQKFVKWSWGWTLCFMTPFLLLLSWARHPGQYLQAFRGILRLVALTAAWYFWVNIVMDTVHEYSGKCSIEAHSSGGSRACRRGGGRWDGFDISGHSFLLVLIVLTTLEEMAPFWHLYESSGVQITFQGSTESQQGTKRIPIFSFLLEILLYILAIIISLMQSLSVLMVLATSLYFHTISHKVIGTALAIITWYITYRLWFKSSRTFSLPLF